jgi:hypothetical protein
MVRSSVHRVGISRRRSPTGQRSPRQFSGRFPVNDDP